MTAAELRDPFLLTKPMSRETWLMRVMILEPARICDPKDLEIWQEKQQRKDKCHSRR